MAANDSRSGVRLPDRVAVVNVGLKLFGDAVRAQGAEAVDVDWRIPAGGDPGLVAALMRCHGALAAAIDAANAEVLHRLDSAAPLLTGMATAVDVVPGMGDRTLLHPGPALAWEEFCDPLRRSVHVAVMAEGWADTPEAADRLVGGGGVDLQPANDHATVGPMATVLGPSSPVFVVENPQAGGGEANRAFAGVNQGPGAAPWFGVDSPDALARAFLLGQVRAVLEPAIASEGPIDVFSVASQGIQMGDDAHMRTQASTNLLVRALLPGLMASGGPQAVEVARFLSTNHLLFLNIVMAAAKSTADWASAVPGASIVTGMSRNGTTFGVRVAGIGRWFTAPAPEVGQALFHPGYGPADGAPDIGDSAVLETLGLGGAAAAASPAVATFLGGKMAGAVAATRAMESICAGRSGRFRIPYLDFSGSPIGIDLRRVVALEVTPGITTGILDATQGRGQVGAGVASAPLEAFQRALLGLVATLDG